MERAALSKLAERDVASLSAGELQRAKIAAPFGYLVEPFQDRELYAAIEMALYRHKTERGRSEEMLRNHDHLEELVEKRTSELTAARELLQTTIDGMIDPVLLVDTDYRVKLMNYAARDGYTVGDGTDPLYCYQVLHDRDTPCDGTPCFCPLEQIRESLDPVAMVHEHVRADGEKRVADNRQ